MLIIYLCSQVTSYDQRQKLLAQTERLQKGRDQLQGATRVAAETEAIGQDILVQLHGQRDQIVRASDAVHGVDDNITRARSILRVCICIGYEKERTGGYAYILYIDVYIDIKMDRQIGR